MKVLSLFDGMSCGQIALNRAGIKYDKYYASEIDKHAIAVTQHNYPNTKQLGDVTKINTANAPNIDLLIGGSPCQGFSFAGKQLNFDDPRSKLFFEYVRLLKELKPKYFLLENVVMKQEYQDVISRYLGVQPVKVNSALVSAQSRNRLYWTNIPDVTQPEDKNITLKHIVENHQKSCLTNNQIEQQLKGLLETSKYRDNFKWRKDKNGRILVMRPDEMKIQRIGRIADSDSKTEIMTCLTQPYVLNNNTIRKVTRLECERLQTVPEGYTSPVSDSQAKRMLGNGWTVDVIAHIFKGIECDSQN